MAFVPPTFNISVNFWDRNDWWDQWPGSVPDPSRVIVGQLRHADYYVAQQSGGLTLPTYHLMVPPDTFAGAVTVNTAENYFWFDRAEIPAGSGCYYFVMGAFDVAAGFMNQYRGFHVVPTWIAQGNIFNTWPNYPYAPTWPRPFPHVYV